MLACCISRISFYGINLFLQLFPQLLQLAADPRYLLRFSPGPQDGRLQTIVSSNALGCAAPAVFAGISISTRGLTDLPIVPTAALVVVGSIGRRLPGVVVVAAGYEVEIPP
jgi:hypothetical protein